MKLTNELREAIENYKKGNEDAFSTIYDESKGYIYVCIANILNSEYKNEDTIQDIMQDAYFDISKNISKLNETDDFLNWAATIAKRRTYDFLRKNGKYVLLGEDESFNDLADDNNMLPEEVVLSKEKQDKVREVINTELTEDERDCVVGYYYNDMKQKDIAKELDIAENTVSSNIFRAKSKMKKALSGVFVVALAACLLIFALNTNAVKEALRKIGGNEKEEAQTKATEESSEKQTERQTERQTEQATTEQTVGLIDGYEHTTNDYVYTYSALNGGWSVTVKDKNKRSYEDIESEILGVSVVNMDYTFQYCENMVTAPRIPSTVKSMVGTFTWCESLTGNVIIDANPNNYDYCFNMVILDEQGIILSGESNILNEIRSISENDENKELLIAKRALDRLDMYSHLGVCCKMSYDLPEGVLSYMQSQGITWTSNALRIRCCDSKDEINAEVNKYISMNVLSKLTPKHNGNENLFEYNGELYMAIDKSDFINKKNWNTDQFVSIISSNENEIVFKASLLGLDEVGMDKAEETAMFTLTYNGNNYVLTGFENVPFLGYRISEGCTYYKKSTGETLTEGSTLYNYAEVGDIYSTKDYEYECKYTAALEKYWSVKLKDKSKEKYEAIKSEIFDVSVISLDEVFEGCVNLKEAPVIPSGIISMYETFKDCTSLTGNIMINAEALVYNKCFAGVDLSAQNITLSGSSTALENIRNTAGVVTVNNDIVEYGDVIKVEWKSWNTSESDGLTSDEVEWVEEEEKEITVNIYSEEFLDNNCAPIYADVLENVKKALGKKLGETFSVWTATTGGAYECEYKIIEIKKAND